MQSFRALPLLPPRPPPKAVMFAATDTFRRAEGSALNATATAQLKRREAHAASDALGRACALLLARQEAMSAAAERHARHIFSLLSDHESKRIHARALAKLCVLQVRCVCVC